MDGSLVFGLPIITFSLQTLLVKDIEYGLAISAFVLSFFYILVAKILWKSKAQGMRTLTEAFLALGFVFVSLSIPLALDGNWTTAAWAMEGAALVQIGFRQERAVARCFSLILQAGAGYFCMDTFFRVSSGNIPVINGTYLGAVLIGLACLFSGYYYWLKQISGYKWGKYIHIILLVWGLLWWFGAGFNEIDKFVSFYYEINCFILFIALSILTISFVYRKLEWKELLYPVLCLLPALIILLLYQTMFTFNPHLFKYYGFISWIASFAVLYFTLYKHENLLHEIICKLQHLGSLWLLIAVTCLEAYWGIDNLIDGAGTWPYISFGIIPAVFSIIILLKGNKIKWSVNKYYKDYHTIGLIPPLFFSWCWLVYGSISNSGDPWPIFYIPIVNPLELAQLFILLVFIIWSVNLRPSDIKFIKGFTKGYLYIFIAFTLFLFFNTVIARSIHYFKHISFDGDILLSSMLYHACLSIFWTLLALLIMVFSTKNGKRHIWFSGAVLLGIVVLKLFFIDFSGSGTVTRIISALAVSILMLVNGFFSPIPLKQKKEQS